MRHKHWLLLAAVIALGLATGTWARLQAQEVGASGRPPVPVIYQGVVTIGTAMARSGTRVNAYVEGVFCGGTTTEGAAYHLLVPSLAVSPGRRECLQAGTLLFKVQGAMVSPTAPFQPEAGVVALNLQATAPCVNLTPEWNSIAYLGPDGPLAERIAAVKEVVEAVFRWDNAAKGWEWFLAGAPPEANSLAVLRENDALWVRVKGAAQWCWTG